jgi:hypothetical protein
MVAELEWEDAMTARTLASTPAMLARARTCYDHLAGRAGVGLFNGLVARGAVIDPGRPAPRGTGRKIDVRLGPAAGEVFAALGIELESLPHTKRRLAFACLDWTERRAHLGGALGAAVLESLLARDWARRRPGTRALAVTQAGIEGLGRSLGIDLRATLGPPRR